MPPKKAQDKAKRVAKPNPQPCKKVVGRKTRAAAQATVTEEPAPPAPRTRGRPPKKQAVAAARSPSPAYQPTAVPVDRASPEKPEKSGFERMEALQLQLVNLTIGLMERMDKREKREHEINKKRRRSSSPTAVASRDERAANHGGHDNSIQDSDQEEDDHDSDYAPVSIIEKPRKQRKLNEICGTPVTLPQDSVNSDTRGKTSTSRRNNSHTEDYDICTGRHCTAAHHAKSGSRQPPTAATGLDMRRDALEYLLDGDASAGHFKRRQGTKTFFPHSYVTRGVKAMKVTMGEATMAEYTYALKLLQRDPDLPKHWLLPIAEHEVELAKMANKYDWWVCRGWSESVFLAISNRTLVNGWDDKLIIKDMQRDDCVASTRQVARRQDYRSDNRQYSGQSTSTSYRGNDRYGDRDRSPSPARQHRRQEDKSEFVPYNPVFDRDVEGSRARRST